MGKVLGGITMSLDGYISDRNGSGGALYPEFEALGESDLMKESIRITGAVVMGRDAYEMAEGDYSEYEFQVPLFILTHKAPETPAKTGDGNLSLTFVTDGATSAVTQAKAAAEDKVVMVIGGADTLRQCLHEGLLDEFQLGIAPVILGGGTRLFEGFEDEISLEKVKTIDLPGGRTDILFRVLKGEAEK